MFCLGGLLSQTLPGKPSIVSVQVFLGLVEAGCAWHGVCLGFAPGCDCARELYLQNRAGRIQSYRQETPAECLLLILECESLEEWAGRRVYVTNLA